MGDLMTASVQIGSRWSKNCGKNLCYSHCVKYILRCRADRSPPNTQRGYRHPRRAGALKGLKESPTSVEPEPAMDCVRRVVWDMLYAG